MPEPSGYDNYPVSTVIVSNALSLLIYCTGLFLVYQFGLIPAVLFALYLMVLEIRVISSHCVDCWYYGKTCAFGKGKISALFFKKGSPERFCHAVMTWTDMLPDLLVTQFSWTILGFIIALVLLGFCGNGFVRGNLACRFCRQREMGCPAEQLFAKKS